MCIQLKKSIIFVYTKKQNIMNYFWNYDYRHTMRDLKDSVKKEVYNTLIEFDLELNGKSDLHFELICEVIGDYTIQGEPKNARKIRLQNSYIQGLING